MKCLLDIDGVILPYGNGELPNRRCAGQDIYLPGHMSDLIRELDRMFEIVWASMWEADANQLGRMLGIGPKPFVRMPRRIPEGTGTIKLPSVQKWDPGGDLVWIDDELGPDAELWATKRGVKLVITDPSVGLTAKQLASLISS